MRDKAKEGKMRKGGQISQAFIYIMAVIVFAIVLIFGYKAINFFIDKGDQFSHVSFKKSLEGAITDIATDYNSVTVYNSKNQLRVPSEVDEVCFLDLDEPFPGSCPAGLSIIACDAWKTYGSWEESEANVFMQPPGALPIKVGRIKMDDQNDFLCFDTNGRLDMRLTGKGSHTLISKVSS
jgi:hypothetical protein